MDAFAVTSDGRSGNTPHSPRRTFFAAWLFVQQHKQRHAQYRRESHCDCDQVRLSEDHPQPYPADEEPEVHGVPHVSIKSHDNQPLGRSHGRRGSVSRPSEVPYAPQCHSETKDRGCGCNPAPSRRVDVEAQPRRQQPEPQGEEGRTHSQRSEGSRPMRATRWNWCGSSLFARHDSLHNTEVCAHSSKPSNKKASTGERFNLSR